MKIVHTMSNKGDAPGPKRRYYSPELKAQVVQQCRQEKASIAAVALTHGINANIVHRWLNEAKNESPRVLRRLQPLRRWSHEQEIKSFFPGSA